MLVAIVDTALGSSAVYSGNDENKITKPRFKDKDSYVNEKNLLRKHY